MTKKYSFLIGLVVLCTSVPCHATYYYISWGSNYVSSCDESHKTSENPS